MIENIANKIRNRTFLISGGTGSFGNTVIDELLKAHPKRIIIFSRDEKKQFDMRNSYDSPTLKFVIGDVRDKAGVEKVMDGVDYVFHAAALKQVPTCEFFPLEAVQTNIIGTSHVLSAAVAYKVKHVVILSTDKAVYPINAMGMTKALMEKIMVAEARNLMEGRKKTVLCGVRYGNVLYSRGSVLPYFVQQMQTGNILTVTNYGMTRFLLPLRNAVDLVLYALAYGKNGYIYVRKSPACTVETLAQAVCEIFRYKKGYKKVGVRAGEKMHETLIAKEELVRSKSLGDFYEIPPESQGLDYNKYYSDGRKIDTEDINPYTSENTKRLNLKETINLLLTLPEIRSELQIQKREKT